MAERKLPGGILISSVHSLRRSMNFEAQKKCVRDAIDLFRARYAKYPFTFLSESDIQCYIYHLLACAENGWFMQTTPFKLSEHYVDPEDAAHSLKLNPLHSEYSFLEFKRPGLSRTGKKGPRPDLCVIAPENVRLTAHQPKKAEAYRKRCAARQVMEAPPRGQRPRDIAAIGVEISFNDGRWAKKTLLKMIDTDIYKLSECAYGFLLIVDAHCTYDSEDAFKAALRSEEKYAALLRQGSISVNYVRPDCRA
jgi:hypothetical protein